ncbi:MAG: hypothetical protein II819_07640 [Fibrobacter sp.]|nr:hypothetical protein [Fibrobacter sp.]
MNMFCKIGITSAICAAALFTGCSDDSSSGTPVTPAWTKQAGANSAWRLSTSTAPRKILNP